jgi:chloramphenicol 3-O phosphotransferase
MVLSTADDPGALQPGIGLRPGGERPDLAPLVVILYRAMYDAIAAHSRLGLNVVVDVGHHDGYSLPRGILLDCARRLSGLPAWFVGVRCALEVVMQRRQATWGTGNAADGSVPMPVRRWQNAVHAHGLYDLEVDTSRLSPEECANTIRRRLEHGPPCQHSSILHQRRLTDAEKVRLFSEARPLFEELGSVGLPK